MDDYCITDGHHNICRIVTGGEEHFEVWVSRGSKCLARFTTAEEAREWCAKKPVKGGRDFEELRLALGEKTA